MARAIDAGIRVIGPNCMGLYVPGEKIAFQNGFPPESGNVMAISQSGGNAMDIIFGLALRGVRFSKLVSFGNAADVAAPELFDYAAADPATEYVISYLEGRRRRAGAVRGSAALRARQADDHPQGRPHRRRGARRQLAHRIARRLARRLRGDVPPDRRDPRRDDDGAARPADRRQHEPAPRPGPARDDGRRRRRFLRPRCRCDGQRRRRPPGAGRGGRRPSCGGSCPSPATASATRSTPATSTPAAPREDSLREVLRVAAHAPDIDALFVTTGSAPSWIDPPAPGSKPDPERERRREERRLLAEKQSMQDLIDLQAEAERPVIGVRRARRRRALAHRRGAGACLRARPSPSSPRCRAPPARSAA